jgi:hypothetical protein
MPKSLISFKNWFVLLVAPNDVAYLIQELALLTMSTSEILLTTSYSLTFVKWNRLHSCRINILLFRGLIIWAVLLILSFKHMWAVSSKHGISDNAVFHDQRLICGTLTRLSWCAPIASDIRSPKSQTLTMEVLRDSRRWAKDTICLLVSIIRLPLIFQSFLVNNLPQLASVFICAWMRMPCFHLKHSG